MPLLRNNSISKIFKALFKKNTKNFDNVNNKDIYETIIDNKEQNTLPIEYIIPEKSEVVPIIVNPKNQSLHRKTARNIKTSKHKSSDTSSDINKQQESEVIKPLPANNISLNNLLENILEESKELDNLMKILGEQH